MEAKYLPWAFSLQVDSGQGKNLAPIFGDVNQSERLSEIKPPLGQAQTLGPRVYYLLHNIFIISKVPKRQVRPQVVCNSLLIMLRTCCYKTFQGHSNENARIEPQPSTLATQSQLQRTLISYDFFIDKIFQKFWSFNIFKKCRIRMGHIWVIPRDIGICRCMDLVQTHKCSLLIMGPNIFQIKLC